MKYEIESALTELHISEEGSRRGRMGRRRYSNDDQTEFKSKNLFAERRRRQKLSDRLLELRALVPFITNMNKATIIEDAITYIQDLQMNVEVLQEQIFEMEASSEEEAKPGTEETYAADEMKKSGIQAEVEAAQIDENKLWVKIVLEKKRGGFSRLMEAMGALGFELFDTTVTSSKGAMLVSSCVKGKYGERIQVQHTRELLLEIINGI
ncbi:transcription factor DYT1-like [Corylus avellana]|uniref:transcription factor DYT1-like n=1 Tax=Corylus avellana TaxID=13451 RepID=UPI00286C7084|nr:transcription factor DYT1-like [Corylus avellana]